MLLGPVLHYLLQYLFLLILSFDSLGFIVSHNKTKDQSANSLNDYSRLVFSWVYVLSLKSLNCWLCCIPLIDELVLIGIVFFTLPILNGTQKANNFLLKDDGFKSTFQGLIDLIINKIVPPKKN
jgi:hypothetical protein